MGMLEKIFGRREQPKGLKNAQIFRMLEGYTPAWTTWRGSVYESELIRAALDAWGRHAAKLKPNVRGSAVPELQNRLKVRPNAFQEWTKFLYQTATILGVRNNTFLVKTRNDDGTPNGIINIVPQSWELVEYAGEPWIRFFLNGNNLLCLDHMKGMVDPESNHLGASTYPTQMTLTLGIDVGF